MEVTDSDKHSSLLQYIIKYIRKGFIALEQQNVTGSGKHASLFQYTI